MPRFSMETRTLESERETSTSTFESRSAYATALRAMFDKARAILSGSANACTQSRVLTSMDTPLLRASGNSSSATCSHSMPTSMRSRSMGIDFRL